MMLSQRRTTILQCHSLKHLFTKLRDRNTPAKDFAYFARRLNAIICEEALALMDPVPVTVTTPTGVDFHGETVDTTDIVAVSIIRSGDCLLESFIHCVPGASVGKILIQRDESTHQPVLFYSKLPPLSNRNIVLVDPMLGTGGSAKCAISVLIEAGADIKRITFVNVISCPEGIQSLHDAYPDVHIITGACDPGMNEHKYIIPGLGDYGDRFFGTK